ncbi:amyloid protein-binding protein 2-like [Ochlerotatus camptorhynchus]|uniref:amyloid protein-binding protein 2-like n=1 Tax=Ochlerotatus camptorhynchus TaxID=644619 RepID=UPI0031DEEF41
MLPDIFNVINKARFSGINNVPKVVPTLYQRSVKVFVSELNRIGKPGEKIAELHDLPAVALSSILQEMSLYPSLRRSLHQELSDPVLFMRMFSHGVTDRLVLENCLRKASLIGKPVLPDLATNYCRMVNGQDLDENSPRFERRIMEAMKLGNYLHEAGWCQQSMEVFNITLRLISHVKDVRLHKMLVLDCTQKLLRSEGSALLTAEADETCQSLLSMTEDDTDSEILLKIYLEVANHHFKARRVDESHCWNSKAMQLINESTAPETVIEVLQLEALYCFQTKHYDSGTLISSQAIHRARHTFGHLHRRYADTLYTYGVCLLKMNAISDAIPILLEMLDIITKLYGKYTPHVAIIQSYLAYGFYHRSQTTGRFDMAYDHIQKAIMLAKQIMPERRKIIEHFAEVRNMILKGRDDVLVAVGEIRATRLSDFQVLTIQEIKDKCAQVDAE